LFKRVFRGQKCFKKWAKAQFFGHKKFFVNFYALKNIKMVTKKWVWPKVKWAENELNLTNFCKKKKKKEPM